MMAPQTSHPTEIPHSRLLVGIGSAHGDDQIGWMVARWLQQQPPPPGLLIRLTSVPLDLLDWMEQSTELHVVDACDGPEAAGHLYRWDWHTLENGQSVPDAGVLRGTGTHDFGIVSVLTLAQQLGRLPKSVTIWGIQGARFAAAESLSPAVAAKLPAVVDVIAGELIDARTIAGAIAADAG